MSRRRPADDDLLFDLPLGPPAAARELDGPAARELDGPAARELDGPAARELDGPAAGEPEQPPLPLVEARDHEPAAVEDHAAGGGRLAPEEPVASPRRPRDAAAGPRPGATLGLRLAAGLTDLGVCAAVLVVLLVALLAQGVRPGFADWPAAVLFLLTFSFLYSVLPLAFWGRTPGMALAGLRSSSSDGRPLTFRQAVLGWLGGVLTVALAGLPLLLALGGRSLSDLLSGSRTRRLVRTP